MMKRHLAYLLAAAMMLSGVPFAVAEEPARLPDEPAPVEAPAVEAPEAAAELMEVPAELFSTEPALSAPEGVAGEAEAELVSVELPRSEGEAALFSAASEEPGPGDTVNAIKMDLTYYGEPCGSIYFTTSGTSATLVTARDLTGSIQVPASFQHGGTTYQVTKIGRDALCNQKELFQVWLPNDLRDIGSRAFAGCDHLKAVGSYTGGGDSDPYALPDGLSEIHEMTFYGCTRLSSVKIGANVTDIWHSAFAYCYSLGQNYTDASGVTYGVYFDEGSRLRYIHQWAFLKCIVMDNITLPDRLEYIGPNAFEECSGIMTRDGEEFYVGLKDLVIPDSVKTIGEKAFMTCCALDTLSIPATARTIGDKAFWSCSHLRSVEFRGTGSDPIDMGVQVFYWCRSLEKIQLPANLKVLPDWTFGYAALENGTTEVVLPEGMEEIGQYAFNESGIRAVTFPKSLNQVKMLAFGDCHNLREIHWAQRPEGDPIFLGMMAFTDCGLTEITLPDITGGDNLFYDCDSLRTVTFAEGADSIPESCFRDCDALTAVTLPTTLESIGEQAFYSCPSLTEVNLAEAAGLKTIGKLAFCRTALTDVTIPASVETIRDEAFGIVRSLTGFTVAENNVGGYYADQGVLCRRQTVEEEEQIHLVRYPAGAAAETYAVPEGITHIDRGAFSHSERLVTVTFPASLKDIGTSAFSHCVNLKYAQVGPNVTQGQWVFDGCYNLISVTIPEGTVVVGGSGKGTFTNFPALAKVTTLNIPASVETILSVHYSNGKDENDNTIYVPGSPFQVLLELERFTVDPANENFVAVDGVLFSRDMTTLVAYPPARAGESYTVPDGVTTIVADAFEYAANLRRVTLPASVTNAGANIFNNIPTLQQVDIYRNFADITITSDFYGGYSRLFYNNAADLQVNVQGDPDSPDAAAFVEAFSDKSNCAEQRIRIGFIAPAEKAGDRFRENGIIYTLVDTQTVKVGPNPNYVGGQITIPGQVEHGGRFYTVSSVENGAFTGAALTSATVMLDLTEEEAAAIFGDGVAVTTRSGLASFTLSDNDLTYGDTLVVNAPAGLAEGERVTLTGPGGTAEAPIRGGVAVFSDRKALYDAAGSNGQPVSVTLSCGDVSTQAELTVSPKVFTPEYYTASDLRFHKSYDGSKAVDLITDQYLDYFTLPGDDLAFHLTGSLPDPNVSYVIYHPTNGKLTFTGADARFYAIDSSVTYICGVEHGQLYIKEVDGVLQRPRYFRAWSVEDGMRIRDCGLSGGQFVAYIPTMDESGKITGYDTLDVEGYFVFTDHNPYPALPDISYLPVSAGGVYHWSFRPDGNGENQELLNNYRFDGSFMPWDPTLSKDDSDGPTNNLVGEAGENPPLPGYVKPTQPETPPETPEPAPEQPSAPDDTPIQDTPDEPVPTPTPTSTPTPTPTPTPGSGGAVGGGSIGGGSVGGGSSAPTHTATPAPVPTADPVVNEQIVAQAVKGVQPGETVVISAPVTAGTSAVTLSAQSVKAVSDAGAAGLTVQTAQADVTLDAAALELVRGKEVTVSAVAADLAELSDAAARAIAGNPAYEVTVTAGDGAVSQLGTGRVKVAVPARENGSAAQETDRVAYRVEPDGSLVLIPTSGEVDGKLVFQVDHLSTYTFLPAQASFADVTKGWAKGDIEFVAAREIMVGTGRDAFSPKKPITGAMAVTVLGRLSGVADPESGRWYQPHLDWAQERGLLFEGFQPKANLTREEMAYLLAQYMGSEPSGDAPLPYVDVEDIDPAYRDSVRLLYELDLMHGQKDGSFNPKGQLTRAELAAILHRLILSELR